LYERERTGSGYRSAQSEFGVAALLFALALLPRIFGLNLFLTADEPLWAERSINFLKALLSGQPGGTLQTGHPGVTTMWTGSLGLLLAYLAKGRPTGSLLAFLEALPPGSDRMDATLISWLRLPTVVLAALFVAGVYLAGRRLFGQRAGLLAAILLALDPAFLIYSRVLHHDALAAIFMSLSLGLLLLYLQADGASLWLLALSGAAGGLAFLSKSGAYFLVPFVGLVLFAADFRTNWRRAAGRMALWLAVAGVIFLILWPALWANPPAVFEALVGRTGVSVGDDSETVGVFWAEKVADLGAMFYPVNWLLRATPLLMLGVAAWPGWWREARRDPLRRGQREAAAWLGGYALLFALLLTFGDKRDGRYLLPIYPAVCLLAALGLEWLGRRWLSGLRSAALVGLALAGQALFVLPSYPYYLTYYNPLVGGPWVAPRLVKVGWGEGMEQAAHYLNGLEDAEKLTVATSMQQTFAPFFKGRFTKHHYDEWADYVLNYIRQVQNGYPYPEYWMYFSARQPVYTLRLGGIDYVWLYRGPSPGRVHDGEFGGGPVLMGYLLEQKELSPGAETALTLIWRWADDGYRVRGWLVDEAGGIWGEWPAGPLLSAEGPSSVEGHYRLRVAADAPDGEYRLAAEVLSTADGRSLGKVTFGSVKIGGAK
jgi:hypothetical protein